MITIAELKKQYPQYQNIADDELAEKFYNKYYKGKISLNDFKNKVLPSSASVTEKKETKAIAPLVEGLDVFGAGEGIGGTPNIDLPPEQLSSIEQYLMSDSFKRLALEVVGGVAGAAFAPAIAPAVLIGRAAAFVRPALQQLATRMAGAGIGESIAAGASQAVDPKESVAKEMLRGFATGVVGEGVGALANRAISKAVGRSKKIIDGADDAVDTIEKVRKKILSNPESYDRKLLEAAKTGRLTPGLLQEGQFLDLLENISELSLIGGASVRYSREGAETLASEGVTDFVNRFKIVADKQELGQLIHRTLSKDLEMFKRVSNANYAELDKALLRTNKEAVNVHDLKKLAKIRLDEMGLKTANKQQRTLLNDIANLPPNISFKKANSIRSELLSMQRNLTDPFGNANKQLANEYANYITTQMDRALIPDDVKVIYNKAQEFYKKGAENFNTEIFKKVMESNPEQVYKAIIAAGDQPTLIEETFKLINKSIKDPEKKRKIITSLRGEFLDDLIKASSSPSGQYGDILDANKINRFMRNKEMVFGKLFTKEQIRELDKFNNALAFSQGRLRKKGGLPGAIFIQMKQSGAVMNLAKLGSVGAAGAAGGLAGAAGIIIAPAVLGKMFTSPKIIKLLTTGMKYNENQTIAGRTFRQIIAQMAKEGLIDRDEEERVYQEMKDKNL